jgi:3-oxocholest-4-en-26-oate---CoA ligase
LTVEGHYADLWEAIADRFGDQPALTQGARTVSWSDFEHRAARLASALAASGLKAGDSVAAYLYNCPEYLEIFFAAIKIRVVPANVNYRYTSDELLALLDNAQAKAMFFDAALRDRVDAVRDHLNGLLLVEVGGESDATIPGAHVYEDLIAAHDPAPPMQRRDDDVYLTYTGGTTGLPKGVLMNIGRGMGNSFWFRDLFFGQRAGLSPVDYAAHAIESGEPPSAIPTSPLMHSTGLVFASLPTLSAGGRVTMLSGMSFDGHRLLDTVTKTRAQVVAIVGDAFALPIVRALDEGAPDGRPYDTDSVRVLCSAGVAWSAQIKARLFDHIPDVTLIDGCGATEGASYGFNQTRRGDPLFTATFTAAAGLKVLSPNGDELPTGEVGLLGGPTTATGYYRDDVKTAQIFRMIDGVRYAIPGDLGRIESDGSVTLIGRGVTTVNTGGEKVYPAEVEEALRNYPGVDDCLVVGIPDERFGQSVAALVVYESGHCVDIKALTNSVRASLAGYKVPRRIRIVEAIPRLPNGKIDYPTAQDMAAAATSHHD